MEGNELMIGNYLLFNGSVVSGWEESVITVSGIEETYLVAAGSHALAYKYIEPIPLTEDWLVKFGFENIGQQFSVPFINLSGHISLHVALTGVTYLKWSTSYIEMTHFINSVHQLQNLYFALTGTHLTLTPPEK